MRHSSEDFAVADVIDDWNRRWTDPALTARIEELEAERDRLREAGVPVFVKQLEINGKLVKDINKFPPELQIRQIPWKRVEK